MKEKDKKFATLKLLQKYSPHTGWLQRTAAQISRKNLWNTTVLLCSPGLSSVKAGLGGREVWKVRRWDWRKESKPVFTAWGGVGWSVFLRLRKWTLCSSDSINFMWYLPDDTASLDSKIYLWLGKQHILWRSMFYLLRIFRIHLFPKAFKGLDTCLKVRIEQLALRFKNAKDIFDFLLVRLFSKLTCCMATERQEKILKVRSAERDSGNFGVTHLVLGWSLDSRRQDCHHGDHCRDNFMEREGAGFPWWLSSKDCLQSRRLGFHPWSGRSPGEQHGCPLWYSCLRNLTDRGAWWAITHGVAKSWTWLSD